MSTRSLDDLDGRFKPVVFEFLSRLTEAKIPVLIVSVLRTIEEQQQNITNGVSWTMNSKHLPQPPNGKSLAIDLVPYQQFLLNGEDKLQWDGSDPVWQKMAVIATGLGMRCGYFWKERDLGHFEYVEKL